MLTLSPSQIITCNIQVDEEFVDSDTDNYRLPKYNKLCVMVTAYFTSLQKQYYDKITNFKLIDKANMMSSGF